MSGRIDTHNLDFVTPPTIGKFMLDDSFVRLLVGPVGSGKSAGCFMELLRRARLQTPDNKKVRQTRMAIIRNTLQQLKQTCLADIEMWLSPIMTYKVSDSTIKIQFPLSDGTIVKSDWMLIPLDTKPDQQRLLSLNLTGAWVSEFREIDPELISSLSGRLGRFPSKAVAEPTWFGIVAESNPPDEDSDWFTLLEVNRPPNWAFYRQPGGLDKDRQGNLIGENLKNLPDKYYETLVVNNNEDWSNVHVHAKYGKSLGGQAVFRASFKPDFHIVAHDTLVMNRQLPLMIGQDFGRTPASLIGQVDNKGRLVVYYECTTEDMGIEQFTKRILRPILYKHCSGMRMFMVADPSGRHKGQANEDSPFDALKRLGFQVESAPTNSIDPRLRAVEQLLLQQVDGGPALILSDNCSILCSAMKYWYRYRRKKTGSLEDKPEKTHPWSDVADCLQYMAMSTNAGYLGRVLQSWKPLPQRAAPSKMAWT